MSVLTRDFTKKEKVLIVILSLIILGAVYYIFVYSQVESRIQSARLEAQAIEDEIRVSEARLEKINEMSAEMNDIESGKIKKSYMPSYNAGKSELDFLHSVISGTKDYYVNFTNLTKEDNQIKRDFTLQFTAKDFAQAEEIVKQLEEFETRCILGDVYITPAVEIPNFKSGNVVVSLTGTFYETMIGGTPDKELPADSE